MSIVDALPPEFKRPVSKRHRWRSIMEQRYANSESSIRLLMQPQCDRNATVMRPLGLNQLIARGSYSEGGEEMSPVSFQLDSFELMGCDCVISFDYVRRRGEGGRRRKRRRRSRPSSSYWTFNFISLENKRKEDIAVATNRISGDSFHLFGSASASSSSASSPSAGQISKQWGPATQAWKHSTGSKMANCDPASLCVCVCMCVILFHMGFPPSLPPTSLTSTLPARFSWSSSSAPLISADEREKLF